MSADRPEFPECRRWADLDAPDLGGLRNAAVYLLAVDPIAPSTIYTTVAGVVIKTTDGGAHWVDAGVGVAGWVNSLWIDAASPSTLYAETTLGLGKQEYGRQALTGLRLSNGLPTFTFNVQGAPSRQFNALRPPPGSPACRRASMAGCRGRRSMMA